MLNISDNIIPSKQGSGTYKAFQLIYKNPLNRLFLKCLTVLFVIFIIMMFIPWTQNIQSKGYLITLRPEQRPQTINSVIGGKIEHWYVKEGDQVKKGDTIIFISEIKSEYFDPKLIERTREQLNNKSQSIVSYQGKIETMTQQKTVFEQIRNLKMQQGRNKLKQARLKVTSDSMDLIAFEQQEKIAEQQYLRTLELYKQGLKSLTEVEQKNLKVQETNAKVISQENKLISSENDVINSRIELSNIESEFREKSNKLQSDQFTVISEKFDAESNKAKLENQLSNYSIRQGMYYVIAAMDGFVTKLIRSGIGETIKEGEELVSLMPIEYDLAVEFYVDPVDYPLLKKNEHVRLQFDGWPAVFFRGWPNTSFGTYGGRIIAIDNFISKNGQYRSIVVPDKKDHPWPKEIRVGGGAKTFTLLNDVPIWYEIWRNMNGFPPEYYAEKNNELKEAKKDDKNK